MFTTQTSVVVDRRALEDWLSEGLIRDTRIHIDRNDAPPAPLTSGSTLVGSPSPSRQLDQLGAPSILIDSAPVSQSTSPKPTSADDLSMNSPSPSFSPLFDNSEIGCGHGKLDPAKASNMKRINKVCWALNVINHSIDAHIR